MLRTSPIKFADNLLLKVNLIDNIMVNTSISYNAETVKRLPPHEKLLLRAIRYLIPNTKANFTQLTKAFTQVVIFWSLDP